MSRSEHRAWWLVFAVFTALLLWCYSARAEIIYDFGCPLKVRRATETAISAWECQLSESLPWGIVKITYDKHWQGNPLHCAVCEYNYLHDGVTVCSRTIRINARHYKWKRGDFGRIGKLCALDGALMHELGHVLLIPDLPCSLAVGWNEQDPLGSRDVWPTLYGRMWPGKLTLEAADIEAWQNLRKDN